MLEFRNVSVVFNKDTINEKIALNDINLTIEDGDFITVIGSNGAGKSTFLNAICGSVSIDEGSILNNGKDISFEKEYRRSKYIGHLYQDPLKGSAPSMSIEENLGLANSRGKRIRFGFGVRKKDREFFKEICKSLDLGLEDRMKSAVGLLSGGQRQALSLLMATIQTPELLLLDEHTAALDPKTSERIMAITKNIVEKNKITTIMVTHNIESALKYGNKTIVMNNGKILTVLKGEKRKKMTIQDIMELYSNTDIVLSDRFIL